MAKKNTKKSAVEDKFSLIFENSPIAIWEEDLSGLAKLQKRLKTSKVDNIHKYLVKNPSVVRRIYAGAKICNINQSTLDLYETTSKTKCKSHIKAYFSKANLEIITEQFTALLEGESFFQAELRNKTVKGDLYDVLIKVSVPQEYKDSFQCVIVTLQNVTERKKLERYLRRLSQVDSLTGLYNHNTISRRLEAEVIRAKRYGSHFSVMMMDIDHFKVVNDQNGHQNGDIVLKKVAQMIKKSVRQVDSVGRYGGDEFLIILPETEAQKAVCAAKRIQKIFLEKTFRINARKKTRLQLSIGICGYPSEGVVEFKDMISKADNALYDAKERGRNRIVVAK